MKILKGDIVYVRSGKDVAGITRLPADAAGKPMAEQLIAADKAKNTNKSLRGKVLRVLPSSDKLIVEGMNMVTKHQRPRATSGAGVVQQGGRIQMEAPIPASRVMLVCTSCDRPTRVSMRVREVQRQKLTGEKTTLVRDRVCKQCGEVIIRPRTEAS